MLRYVGRCKPFAINPCFPRFPIPWSRDVHSSASAKPFRDVPKIRSLPIFGSSWIYLPIVGRYRRLDVNEAAWHIYRRYGPIVAEEIPGRNVLVHVFSADDIRTLYQEEKKMPYRMGADPFRLYHDHRPEYFANSGIMYAQGEVWLKIRNMGQASILRTCAVESFAESIDQVTDDAVKLITSRRDHEGDVEGCYEILTRWSLEAIVSVTLGRRLGLLENQLNWDAARIMQALDIFLQCMDTLVMQFPYYRYILTPTSWRWKQAGDIMAPFFFSLTKNAAEAVRVSKGKGKKSTVLDHLWSEDLQFKDMFTFLHDVIVAGISTTSGMATYTLLCLAMNPKAQEEAWHEVASLPEQVLSTANSLPYLAACAKEALRFYPIIAGVNLKLRHGIVLSGYQIPANVVLRTEQFVAGRLEENFNRASEFLPERWLRSAKERNEGSASNGEVLTTHPFGSIPFGLGPRSCIGKRVAELEVCTLLAKVLRRYKVENHHGDIGFRTMLAARPERPVKLRFLERSLR